MPYVSADDGVKIYYTDTGGDGPAVMLVHSFFMDADMWQPQVEALGGDYRVICLDTRGHGRTDDAGVPFDSWRLAWDGWAVANHLGIERLVLGGLSQGGWVVLRMALQHRSRTRGLVLIGTSADAYSEKERDGYEQVIVDGWVNGSRPIEEIGPPMAAVMIGGDRETHQEPWVEKWVAHDRRRLGLAARCLIDREGISSMLGAITASTILLRGAGDQAFTHDQMQALADGLAGPTRFETVRADGLTHLCSWTHPQLVNPLLREFLDDLPD